MIYTHAAAAIGGAALAALATWHVQAWRYDAQIADIHTQHAAAALERSEAARAAEATTAGMESTHAAATQENSDAFTLSAPVRDAIARADAARSDRLRTDAERRAATYRAMAEAGATACRDLADRHEALDRHVVEGVTVVGTLRNDLVRRDAEVKLLRRQLDVERALTGD